MIFTDDGMVYKLKVHEVPDAAASARGKAVVNLINIPSDRRLAGVVPVREFAEGRYVVMVTRKGVIKKTSLADFQNIRTNGIIAINVDEGDQLLDVVLTDGTKRIFIATHNGLAIRFDEKNVRPMGRATRGVRGIDLRQDDFVVSVCPVSAEDKERMLSVSEQGYGKQTPITTYRLQSRGGKGVINMKTTDKTGKVVAVFPVEDESEIMIITQQGKLIRLEADDIRKTGRSAQGVRLIKTDAGDKVTSASLVEAAAEEETEEVAAVKTTGAERSSAGAGSRPARLAVILSWCYSALISACLRRYPLFSVFEHFLLPDRHGAFEFFDGPFTGLKGGLAVWRADGDHDTGFTDIQSPGAVHDPDVGNLESLVSFSAEALHLSQRHRVIRFINQVQRSFSLGPFARVAIQRDCGSTLRQHNASRNLAHVDRFCS